VVILVVIVVTFIGFGSPGSRFRPGGGGTKIDFGSYRGLPIQYYPNNYFAERVNAVSEQLRSQAQSQGQENTETLAYQVWRTAFDQTVIHEAFLWLANTAGAWVSEDRVTEALIKSGPWTYGGAFNEDRYRATSNADKYAYRKLFREELLDAQVQQDLLSNPRFSQKEIGFFKGMISSQRKFSFVSFPLSSFPDSELKAYAEKNLDKFRRIKLSQILIKSSESEAQAIRSKLEDRSASFEEMARAHSKDSYAEKGGEAGWRYFYDLESEFDNKAPLESVMSLPEGAISPVLKSRFGWVIYRVDSPALRPDLNDPDTLKVVRDYMMRYEKGQVEDYFVKKADGFKQRTGDVGFVGAALALGLKTYQTDYFPLNYQNYYFLAPVRSTSQDVNLSSAANNEDFFLKAFSLGPGQVSGPVLLDDQVVVLKLDEVRQAPSEQLDMTDRYYSYFAEQALQGDLQAALLKPEYLKDNFQQVFFSQIYRPQQTKQQQ
jgi:peptidyl-prolyl cis-trans isomerase D